MIDRDLEDEDDEDGYRDNVTSDRRRYTLNVRCGDMCEVSLCTDVYININEGEKAVQEIRDAIRMLLRAMPIAEIKDHDENYRKSSDKSEFLVDEEGKVISAPKGHADGLKAQGDLKKTYDEKEKKKDAK